MSSLSVSLLLHLSPEILSMSSKGNPSLCSKSSHPSPTFLLTDLTSSFSSLTRASRSANRLKRWPCRFLAVELIRRRPRWFSLRSSAWCCRSASRPGFQNCPRPNPELNFSYSSSCFCLFYVFSSASEASSHKYSLSSVLLSSSLKIRCSIYLLRLTSVFHS